MPSTATRSSRAVLLLLLLAAAAAASTSEVAPEQTAEQMLEDMKDAIEVPEAIELDGNPGAFTDSVDDVEAEDEGIDDVASKAVKIPVSAAMKKRIASRVLRSGCRKGICVGTSTIDLTFIVDGKNFQRWRPFAAKLVNRLRVARYQVRVNMIVAGTKPHMLFDFDSAKLRIISKIRRTRYTSSGGNVALGDALYFYRKRVLKRGRRFSGKLIMVLTSVDSNSGRSVSKQVNYLNSKGVTFLPVMVGYDVSQAFWKSRATGGKYVWVPKFASLEFVVDAFVHMRIRWKMKMSMSSVLKCPPAVRYKTPCKHGFVQTMEIGFVKVINRCNPVTKVVKRKSCGCEKSQCFASQAMELILVMQATEDLGELHFRYEKEFVVSMIRKMKIGAKSVRVSVVLFSSKASLAFRLTAYTTQASVISAINGLTLLTGKDRAIGDALLIVREQVLTDSVEQSAKMLIVITSGDSNYGRSVEVETARLQEMSVSILVIGVGPDVSDASLQVISTVYIHIHTWIKLRFAAKYVLRMRISFVAQPAVHGALKIRCPKYRRVLISKCVAGHQVRTIKFYKMVSNTCMPYKQVKKETCRVPRPCKEGTKVHVGRCELKTHLQIITRVHTSKIHDCSGKKCVWRCSKRLVRTKLSCRKIRCVKSRLTVERTCSKSGFRRIYWGFYTASGGRCRRVGTKIVRQIPCDGCSKRQIRIFRITIGKKCSGGQKAIYSSFFASHKGRCSYKRLQITKRRCIVKRCPRRARIQIDTNCVRKGSRYRGVYWTHLTRLQANGPCVRVYGRLIRLIPCGGCTSVQRSFQQVTTGKICESGFITSYVTVYQGEESRPCHKTKVVIKKRTCKSCPKPRTTKTACIGGFVKTFRIQFTVKGTKCVPKKTLQSKVPCEGGHGCKKPHKVHTRCSPGQKYKFTTTYYYQKHKLCTGVVVPPKRTCSKVADLVFVLDSSTSIQDADFAKESQFVRHIVRKMGVSPTGIRVAVITFSTTPKLVFNLDQYSTKSQVLAAMSKLPRDEGITMTSAAIDLVDSEIFPKRRAGVPFVVVVVTDGKSTTGDPIASAEVLKKKGARFVSVGIYNPDPSVTDKINPEELKGISSSGKFWRAGDFTKLDSIVGSVAREVCHDMGESKPSTGGKRVCKSVCVKKRRISGKVPCPKPIDCTSKTIVRHCKKHRAYRVITRVTYVPKGGKCVVKTRKVIKKLPCPPRKCPAAKTIRTTCKPGVINRTKTVIFYVSNVRCTRSLPPRCTQICIKKVRRSAVPCDTLRCKKDTLHVTKCGGSHRFRVVVTTKYRKVKGVCKTHITTKRYPCPVKCPKTQIIKTTCKKGITYSVKSIISYTVRRACVLKGKCTVKCVRRVLRTRTKCRIPPPDRRCKQPPAYWTKCIKHSAYKYKIRVFYKNVLGHCVIVKRLTVSRLLCPPRRCPKSKRVVRPCTKGTKFRVTTTVFYSGKIVCTKSKPVVCHQVCTKRITRSSKKCPGVPIICDTTKKIRVTKCGGKRRYRSVYTTWNTLYGKVCKKHKSVKHYPCPVTCKKSKTIKRTKCTKGTKYQTITISTSTVKRTCVKSICTLRCVRKTIHSRVLCPVIPPPPTHCKKPYKVHTRCSARNTHSYTTTYFFVKKTVCRRTPKTGKRFCNSFCVKKHKISHRKQCKKPCRFVLSYHTSKCVGNLRTITAKYRTLIRGRCVWRRKVVRRVNCGGCTEFQNHYHKTTVGKKCKAGFTETYLNFYESRKYKTGVVCHKKLIKVSIVKCKCNKKPLLLIDKECVKGYRKATKVVFFDRAGVCIRKQTVTKIKCPSIKCLNKKVLRRCRKDSVYQYIVRVFYKATGGRCVSYKSKIIRKVPCPPKTCPKSKKIIKSCRKGVENRVTTTIFYVGKIVCTKSIPPKCKQICIRRVTRSAVPCNPPRFCNSKKTSHVTKCGVKRRYRSIVTTWQTGRFPKCKTHRTVKHFPCPVRCPKLKIVKIPCVGSREFREERTITYSVKKSCLKSICVLRCVRHVVVSRAPCRVPERCPSKRRILPCSKVSAYRKEILIIYKFKKGKCRVHRERVIKRFPCPCKRGLTIIEKKCRKNYRRVIKTIYIRVRGVCRAKSIVLRRVRCPEPLRCSRSYYVVSSCFHGVRRLLFVSSRRVKSADGKFVCISRTTVVAYFDCQPDCRHGVQRKLVLGCKCVRSQRNLYQLTFTASRSKCLHSVKLMGQVSCNDCLSYLKRWKHWMLRLKLKKTKKIPKPVVPSKPVIKPKPKDRRALLGFGYAG